MEDLVETRDFPGIWEVKVGVSMKRGVIPNNVISMVYVNERHHLRPRV